MMLPRHRPKNFPGNLLHFTFLLNYASLPSTPLYTSGDIEVFKGMQIKELNLRLCGQLTGNIEVFEGMQIKELNLTSCGNLRGECVELGWLFGQDQ